VLIHLSFHHYSKPPYEPAQRRHSAVNVTMSSSSPATSEITPTPTKDAKIFSSTVYRCINDKPKSGFVLKSADIEVKLLGHLAQAVG
jgi:hypothetical protein